LINQKISQEDNSELNRLFDKYEVAKTPREQQLKYLLLKIFFNNMAEKYNFDPKKFTIDPRTGSIIEMNKSKLELKN